jgi:hypothetical protein
MARETNTSGGSAGDGAGAGAAPDAPIASSATAAMIPAFTG